MAIIKAINLTLPTEELRNKYFGDNGNFSGWIQEKLIELDRHSNTEEFTKKELIEAYEQKENIELRINQLKRKLELITQTQQAKVVSEEKEEKSKLDLSEQIKRTLYYFKIYFDNQEEELVKEFLEFKANHKFEDKNTYWVKFAELKGLKFIKHFHFLPTEEIKQ